MGYRSDVTIAVASTDKELLERTLAVWSATEEHTKCADVLQRNMKQTERTWGEDTYYVAYWEFIYVKWYDDYEEPQAFEWLASFINQHDEHTGIGMLSVRIGEDDDDIEQETYGDADIASVLECWVYPETKVVNKLGDNDG